jgi:hypothetical protein
LAAKYAWNFESGHTQYISWDENAGWSDHFSIQCSSSSCFCQGSLSDYDVSTLHPWSAYVGQRLKAWRVLGSNGTPHIIEMLWEPDLVILFGDGYELEIGDGDDLVVTTDRRASDTFEAMVSSDEAA